jgi:hypothetical protein
VLRLRCGRRHSGATSYAARARALAIVLCLVAATEVWSLVIMDTEQAVGDEITNLTLSSCQQIGKDFVQRMINRDPKWSTRLSFTCASNPSNGKRT